MSTIIVSICVLLIYALIGGLVMRVAVRVSPPVFNDTDPHLMVALTWPVSLPMLALLAVVTSVCTGLMWIVLKVGGQA